MKNKTTYQTPEQTVATWTPEFKIEVITECLKAATEKAAKTNDRIHWEIVQDWERLLIETINQSFPKGQ